MEVQPTGLRELERDECMQHLAANTARVGRLGFVAAGAPIILPVNYALHRGAIVFKTGLGTKLDHLSRGEQVAFQVDEVEPAWQAGWSVLVQGVAEEVTDLTEVAALQRLPLQTWAAGRRNRFIRIQPARVTGREIVSDRSGLTEEGGG